MWIDSSLQHLQSLAPQKKKGEEKENNKPKENPPQTLQFEVLCLAVFINSTPFQN